MQSTVKCCLLFTVGERRNFGNDECIESYGKTYDGYIYIYIYILAVKPAFGGLHCYGAPSIVALQRHSGDCDSTTEP